MKVDEQFKCKDCDNYNLCNYYHNRRETSFICKEFQNQWGFIEELEKIKADIEDYSRYTAGNDLVVDWENIEEVFNEHLSELKGESDANNKTD